MAKITYDEILNACIDGIQKSFNEYYEWSGGEWLWNAPEYLLTVNIAKELNKIDKPKFITLEDNIRKTLKNAHIKTRGPLKKDIRPDGKSDIILWWGKRTPRGIIEVKNAVWGLAYIQKDINRVLGILEKKSDIELGVISFYMDRHYENGHPVERLEKNIKEILNSLEKIAKENNLKYRWIYDEIEHINNDVAFAVAFMLYK